MASILPKSVSQLNSSIQFLVLPRSCIVCCQHKNTIVPKLIFQFTQIPATHTNIGFSFGEFNHLEILHPHFAGNPFTSLRHYLHKPDSTGFRFLASIRNPLSFLMTYITTLNENYSMSDARR